MDQLNADFLFEIPDLPAERWLGSVQLLLGGNRQTAGIGHGDEVAEMPELHTQPPPMSHRHGASLQSLSQADQCRL
jgi:hypothetical protein